MDTMDVIGVIALIVLTNITTIKIVTDSRNMVIDKIETSSKAQCWVTTIEQDSTIWHRVKCPFKGEI